MMYNYPFFSFPNFRRYPNYYAHQNSYINNPYINNQILKNQSHSMSNELLENNRYNNSLKKDERISINLDDKNEEKRRSSNNRAPSGFGFLNNFFYQNDRNTNEEYFELLGIKLYNDDLLILSLLFFLYKENVKDQYLFFALILLLLS